MLVLNKYDMPVKLKPRQVTFHRKKNIGMRAVSARVGDDGDNGTYQFEACDEVVAYLASELLSPGS